MPAQVSTEIPLPLPAGLLARLAADHELTLFLDYDGTISEITPDIENAPPVAGVRELLGKLAARLRFRVVVISGRQLQQLVRLLGMRREITLVGNHGLEIMEPNGRIRPALDPAPFSPALDAVREWLRRNVAERAGFVIEDKGFGVALHYRLADPGPALSVRMRFAEFVRVHTPALKVGEGKMVIEAIPRQAGKGEAVRTLMGEAGGQRRALYFGDDVTDEDAFFALRDSGVTVKVSAQPRPSWARYRVASPSEVVGALSELASASGILAP